MIPCGIVGNCVMDSGRCVTNNLRWVSNDIRSRFILGCGRTGAGAAQCPYEVPQGPHIMLIRTRAGVSSKPEEPLPLCVQIFGLVATYIYKLTATATTSLIVLRTLNPKLY